MRINATQCSCTFGKLHIKTDELYDIKKSSLSKCMGLLSKTKHVDVIVDSKGIFIKKKMTETLQKIQSFSLFPLENSVGITIEEQGKKSIYKDIYKTLEEAKCAWKNLYDHTGLDNLESCTKIALWLDRCIESKNNN